MPVDGPAAPRAGEEQIMARKKSDKPQTMFSLKVVGATASVPAVLHGEGRSCTPRGKLGVFMLPRNGKGILYELRSGVLYHAELGASQDVPRKIDKPISLDALNAKLDALSKEAIPDETTDAIKGQWTAAVSCDEEKAPVIVLHRAIGDRNAIVVKSDTSGDNPGWTYSAARPGKTDAKGDVATVMSKGARVGKLRTAIEQAFTDGIKLAATTCARSVTTRSNTKPTKKEAEKAVKAAQTAQAAPTTHGAVRKEAAKKVWADAEKAAKQKVDKAKREAAKAEKAKLAAAAKKEKADKAAAEKRAARKPSKTIQARIGQHVRITAGQHKDMEGKVLRAEPGIKKADWFLVVKTPDGEQKVMSTSVRKINPPKAKVAKPPRNAAAAASPKPPRKPGQKPAQKPAQPAQPFDATAAALAAFGNDPLAGLGLGAL